MRPSRWLLAALIPHAAAELTYSVRQLLQLGRYNEADSVARSERQNIEEKATTPYDEHERNPFFLSEDAARKSDAALAAWLVSGGRGNAPEQALEVFTSLAQNEALPKDVRQALCRNAAFVEGTRPAAFEESDTTKDGSKPRLSYNRAYQWFEAALDLGKSMLEENILYRSFVATPPELIPLTQFDLDLNAAVCTKPGFAPPPHEPFVCGDRNTVGAPSVNGGWAPAAAAASAQRRSAASGAATHSDDSLVSTETVVAGPTGATSSSVVSSASDLYLDLVVRSLTDYLGADLTPGWKDIVLEETAGSAEGAVDSSGADGTAWDLPLGHSYGGFALSGALNTADYPRAFTSLSVGHLHHLLFCIDHVLSRGIEGDFIEAGVFRGGATILMRAALAAREAESPAPNYSTTHGAPRRVFVADSFEGIPPSRRAVGGGIEKEDCDAWTERYAVSLAEVRANFRRFGLLDERVTFLPGFFNVSLPPVFGGPNAFAPPQQPPPKLSIVRIDADAYDGVRDALEALYPRLAVGGVLIIDDWHLVGAAAAAHEYRAAHHIRAPVLMVPQDYVYACSSGGQRVAPFAGGSDAGAAAGPEGVKHCEHPKTSLFVHNKHLALSILPHVAYWFKE
jgi:hypothetical protein